MDQEQFSALIRYRGPSVTARQALFEQVNAALERAFASYLAQPPVDFEDDAYLASNNAACIALGHVTERLSNLAPCDDDRSAMRALIMAGGIEAAHRANSILRAEWQSADDYAAALVEVRTWINLAILADLWPSA